MRRSALLFCESIGHRRSRQAILVILLLCSSLAILVAPRHISSHEPITTKVMFNKEIVRIFQRHCLACHNSASITNISLETYARARPWAKAFKEEVLEKRMPPYQTVKGFGHFQNDYTLTQHEVDQIVSWVEGGAPKGDDKDLPPESTRFGWVLGQPNLILQFKKEVNIAEANTSSRAGEEYRCFALPTNLKVDRWVTAVDFHPGDVTAGSASFSIDRSPGRRLSNDSLACRPDREAATTGDGARSLLSLAENVGRLLPARARVCANSLS